MSRTIHVDAERLEATMRAAGPPTADDVSVTNDGRRLDSLEAVLEWLAELEVRRSGLAKSE